MVKGIDIKKKMTKPVIGVIIVVIVILLVVGGIAFSGILTSKTKKEVSYGPSPNESSQGAGGTWEENITIQGSILVGGPGSIIPDERGEFQVKNTVVRMDILLTWNPQNQDLDLEIENPDGEVVASSGNVPGEPEKVTIAKDIYPGTWTAVIDPYIAVNVNYTLSITFTHQSGGESEGDLLYIGVYVYPTVPSSDKLHDEFSVSKDYSSLSYTVNINSQAGDLTVTIKDPSGNTALKYETSGAEVVADAGELNAIQGKWTVDYNLEDFLGEITITVVGEY